MGADPLRDHVDRLLSCYAKTYLRKDHVQYTYNIFNLLKPYFLKDVPLTDPTAFTLPLEPFDNLRKICSLDQLPRYEERFKANTEAIQLVKQHLRTRPGRRRTDSITTEDDRGPLEPIEPFWPTLTRRSRLSNSKRTTLVSTPTSCNALIRDVKIRGVSVEDIPEPDVPYERTLKIVWTLTSEERGEVRKILKHVTDMRRPQPNYRNSVLHAFLHEDVPLPGTLLPEEEFVPVFARNRRPGHGNLPKKPKNSLGEGLKGLGNFLPQARPGSDDSDADFAAATLEVVDGWQTLNVSSPISVATPTTSQEDSKIDQLFLEDSPPTEPAIGGIEKIEEIQMPRARRIGGSHGKNAHILHGQTLATFLPSALLRNGQANAPKQIKEPSCSPVPESLVGQPSSNSFMPHDEVVEKDDFNTVIAHLCPKEDPADVIMKVKIGDSDTFMEVPPLPSPNKHGSASLELPTKLRDLTHNTERQSDRHPLKKTLKGLPALRLSLSWVSFTTNSPLPSHEEICGVSTLFPSSLEDVEQLVCQAQGDCLSSRNRLAILEEDINLPVIPETDPRPLIAIARNSRRPKCNELQLESPTPDPERTVINMRPSPSDIDMSRSPKRPRIEPEADADYEFFQYEPSVLQFEDLIDTRMFYEFTDSDHLQLSSIDNTLIDQDVIHTSPGAKINFERSVGDIGLPSADMPNTEVTQENPTFLDLSSTVVLPPAEQTKTEMDLIKCHLNTFTQLRAKTMTDAPVVAQPSELSLGNSSPAAEDSLSDKISAVTADRSTLSIPDSEFKSGRPHRYMASMEFIQRQAVVRQLRKCNIDLAERTCLGGVELIIDPFSAIIVSSLFTLPAYGKQLANRIAEQTWRFQHTLVLLEGYPESLSFRPPKSQEDVLVPSAYTPPILKAIQKLRRDVTIAEACGTKNSGCDVKYSFVNNTSETGRIIRYFGDLAEERDQTSGILWQPREWLDNEMQPDEEDLSGLGGMNRMSAAILLCKATPDEILDMVPEERVEEFGPLIGVDAVNSLNSDLQARFHMFDSSSTT